MDDHIFKVIIWRNLWVL